MTTPQVDTATVETLTAEVRVLMVGSRQVTLSVARQLDEVDLVDVEPFGRVNISDTGTFVVGRHKQTGALVRAKVSVWQGQPFVAPTAGRVTVSPAIRPADGGVYRLMFRQRRFDVSKEHVVLGVCDDAWEAADGVLTEIEAQISEHDRVVAMHKAAQALPLIVLAGLR